MNVVIQITLSAILVLPCAKGAIVSTFDADNDGWQVAGDATETDPFYAETGGNPGGYIFADDSVSGGVWRWLAPAKFLGDQRAAFGQTLSFDLIQSGSGSQFLSSDVILTSTSAGVIQLQFDSNPLPLDSWISYELVLASTGAWETTSGIAADDALILAVLSNLDELTIRGEYISGADTGGLDNVRLATVPTPASLTLLAGALGWLRLRSANRRR